MNTLLVPFMSVICRKNELKMIHHVLWGLSYEAHPLCGCPELFQSVQRKQIRWVFVEKLDRLFQPPLLPQSCSICRPRVPSVLRAHPREHVGAGTRQFHRSNAERVDLSAGITYEVVKRRRAHQERVDAVEWERLEVQLLVSNFKIKFW